MGTVLTMRFNRDQAALVADESTWHLGIFYDYRRSNYADAILPLYNLERAEDNDRRAGIYAGVGFPSFHQEVADHCRKQFLKADMDHSRMESSVRTVQETFQSVHRRYVDDRMRFHFYFGLDDLNARQVKRDETSFDLKQDAIIREARKISGYGERGDAMARIYENSGLFVSSDPEEGIQCQVFSPGYQGIGFSSFITAIGHGHAVVNQLVEKLLVGDHDLHQRRAGFSMEEGLHHLLRIAVETGRVTNKMGGYYQVVLLDMTQENKADRIREVADHRSCLMREVLLAESWGYLPQTTARALVSRLMLGDGDWQAVEKELFREETSGGLFRLRLQGFRETVGEVLNDRKGVDA